MDKIKPHIEMDFYAFQLVFDRPPRKVRLTLHAIIRSAQFFVCPQREVPLNMILHHMRPGHAALL